MKTAGSAKPSISVIIPTYNRADLLREALKSLTTQSLPRDEFEVIVIDDGSQDNTAHVCSDFEKHLHLRYQKQINSGISAAKNMGIFMARAPLLFFFDDDDVADANLLAEHFRSHRSHPEENVAVLGYTTWHPSLTITPLMHYVTDVGGFLFSCEHLKHGQTLDFTYFWGGRSSCKRSFLVRHGVFNQQFRFGSEDIELGYRLSKFGLKVVFNRQAISYMIRPLTFDQFCSRCVKQGASQYHFGKMHPAPEIKRYCMLEQAEEKWTYASQFIEKKMQRARELEAELVRDVPSAAKKDIQTELWNLYRWIFTVLKLKGIVEEKSKDKNPRLENDGIDVALTRSISEKDREILRTRKTGFSAKPYTRGNVLIIDPLLPMYDRASGSLRLFEIVRALIRIGFSITYIARSADHAETYIPILQRMGVEVYAGDPTALQPFWPDIIAPYLDVPKILRSKTFDFVILSFWHIAEHYLPIVREHSPESIIIIDTVDIHFLREFREAEIKKDPALMETARQNKERELAVYQKADRLWVVTEDDRRSIESLVTPPIDVIPNIHKHIHETKEFSKTSDLLFVGNFNHRPNIDAVLFLHRKIFPHIRRHLPDVKVFVVGNNPPPQIRKLHSEAFVVTGYVEDLGPYLKNARISINPLTYGAGMKGKIGEALSWGLPVVTTSIGAEGMDLVDKEHAMIADDPKEFARRVVELYNNRALWEKLSANGKRIVEQRWSPDAIQKRIESSFLHASRFHEGEVSLAMTITSLGSIDTARDLLMSVDAPGETVVLIRGKMPPEWTRKAASLTQTEVSGRRVRLVMAHNDSDGVSCWNKALSLCQGGLIGLVHIEGKHLESHFVRKISELVSYAAKNPHVDVLAMRRYSTNIPHAHSSGDPLSLRSASACSDETRPGSHLDVSLMVLRPRVVRSLGGFNTSLRDESLALEDYIARASLNGHNVKIIDDPQGEIPHDRGRVLPENIVLDSSPAEGSSRRIEPYAHFVSMGKGSDHQLPADPMETHDVTPSCGPDTAGTRPLTSIIILCFNGLSLTRQCLESVERFTPEPHEIILVDNGSTDGSTDFLKGYAAQRSHVKLIINDTNTGYAHANNQALSIAEGVYVLFLNNDVIVTDGWLGRMMNHFERNPKIGMVGPVTNCVAGQQLIQDAHYGNDMESMHRFARQIAKKNSGRVSSHIRLVGFCLMARKELLEIIGGFDEGYMTGNFEDDDLCIRAAVAGYDLVIAHDVFVHHFGSMTFKENSIDHTATMKTNSSYFLNKWREVVELQEGNVYKVCMTKDKQISLLNEWGEKAYEEGDAHKALRIFERALHIDPTNTITLNNIAVIQWELGYKNDAIGTFKRILHADPQNVDALANLRTIISELGSRDVLVKDITALLGTRSSATTGGNIHP